jgi:cysteinyl-tRNA synthetase
VVNELLNALDAARSQTEAEFYEAMDDDFNTAAALARLEVLAREVNRVSDGIGASALTAAGLSQVSNVEKLLDHLLDVLGLQLPESAADLTRGQDMALSDDEIQARVAQRTSLREQKRWNEADAVRQALAADGVVVEDRAGGPVWRRSAVR